MDLDELDYEELDLAERKRLSRENADEDGLIYHNRCGQTIRILDQRDVDILVKLGCVRKESDTTYVRTDEPYEGVLLSYLLDAMQMHDAPITLGFYIETPEEKKEGCE